jgi:hypothetical protein
MTYFSKRFLAITLAAFTAPAFAHAASDLMVAATMQRCVSNEDCQLVTNSCADNCGFVPINKTNLPALQQLYQTRCGKPMDANPSCTMNPPINAACINSRCTIDYPFANNAGAKDYQSGAYGVPEAAVPNKVPGDYSKVNDRKGFTAYDLPQANVKENTVGTIVDKVYVPPTAPVTGGNYVPVDSTSPVTPPPQNAAAPIPSPVPPPVPAPSVAATPAPTPPPAAAGNIPPVAVPRAGTYATVPEMKPSTPNQLPPQAVAPAAAPAPEQNAAQYQYVPAQTPPTLPAPGLPRAPVAPATAATAATATPSVPSVGAPGVPQAPAGSIPIPPSDLKPAPTFVPPPGTAIPVSPEDPGAPPPAGTVLQMKEAPDGSPGATVGTEKKTFNSSSSTKKTTVYNELN